MRSKLYISNKLIFHLEKLEGKFNRRTDKNALLGKKKADLDLQLKVLQEENTKSINAKEEELKEIIDKNQQIKEEIEIVATNGEEELRNAEERIHNLMKLADAALLQTREEKEARLKYQRSVSTLYHLEGELKRMELISEKQSKKLGILMQLLETSRDHLKRSIEQKTLLLNQTQDAAEKMRILCEQTLQEEQEFYNERDYDTMHTPPFINVKRRPRD
jgi:hypothetical protein